MKHGCLMEFLVVTGWLFSAGTTSRTRATTAGATGSWDVFVRTN